AQAGCEEEGRSRTQAREARGEEEGRQEAIETRAGTSGGIMAFLRFTRDKRGYEHFYLVQPTTNRRGKVRTRILYWFRTPPNVKVGRQPFDDALRRALEAQNPGIAFDWQKIVDTPIPSPHPDTR